MSHFETSIIYDKRIGKLVEERDMFSNMSNYLEFRLSYDNKIVEVYFHKGNFFEYNKNIGIDKETFFQYNKITESTLWYTLLPLEEYKKAYEKLKGE